MRISLCPQPLYPLGLDGALDAAAGLGVDAIELPVDRKSPLVDLDDLLAGGADALRRKLESRGLSLSALSIHQEGQLLLGPHHEDTDGIHRGSPEEKVRYGVERVRKAGRAAQALGVDVVVGFVGCEDASRAFPWPDPLAWEKMLPRFRERLMPILDEYASLGVRFAQEPHPRQIVYDVETAAESVEVLERHPAWGFNLDPANLLLAGVDPVELVVALPDRILHCHGKDGERVRHHIGRSGLLARGDWGRADRGFRFRVLGWGDVPWKRLVSELILADYRGAVAIENEDPLFEPMDGLRKAIAALRPLLPEGERKERWW